MVISYYVCFKVIKFPLNLWDINILKSLGRNARFSFQAICDLL